MQTAPERGPGLVAERAGADAERDRLPARRTVTTSSRLRMTRPVCSVSWSGEAAPQISAGKQVRAPSCPGPSSAPQSRMRSAVRFKLVIHAVAIHGEDAFGDGVEDGLHLVALLAQLVDQAIDVGDDADGLHHADHVALGVLEGGGVDADGGVRPGGVLGQDVERGHGLAAAEGALEGAARRAADLALEDLAARPADRGGLDTSREGLGRCVQGHESLLGVNRQDGVRDAPQDVQDVEGFDRNGHRAPRVHASARTIRDGPRGSSRG